MEDWPSSSQLNAGFVSRYDRFLTVITEIVFAEELSADAKKRVYFRNTPIRVVPRMDLKSKPFVSAVYYGRAKGFFVCEK